MSVTPATLAVQTTWPAPCSTSTGPNASAPWITPRTLTSSTHFHTSSGVSNIGPTGATPALRHTTWTPPKRAEGLVAQLVHVVDRANVARHAEEAITGVQRSRSPT